MIYFFDCNDLFKKFELKNILNLSDHLSECVIVLKFDKSPNEL